MSIRILGGEAKGMRLTPPKNSNTRPTSVMLKRKLFDSIQNFSGITFFDLCAGTGSMGLEALSRGAENVYLLEKDFKMFKVLSENCLAISDKYSLSNCNAIKQDSLKWLEKNLNLVNSVEQSIIFFDPPYEDINLYKRFLEIIENIQDSTVVVEACKQKTFYFDEFSQLFRAPDKTFVHGTSYFAIFEI